VKARHQRARAGLVALALASLAGRGAAEEVTVFAAASLNDALREVAGAFEARTGHRVVFNVGGSSDLARQIVAGARADLFFSADRAQMDRLEAAGLVRAAHRQDVLSNVLVVVVPAGSPAGIRGPRDLAGVKRLAVANPEAVPAGVYARAWLESVGLWEELKGRVVPTLDVRAALAAVESEHAGAGIVYRTDAAISKRVEVAFEVPRDQGPAIVYQLALVTGSEKPAAAGLLRHLTSEPARATYRRHGFVVLAR